MEDKKIDKKDSAIFLCHVVNDNSEEEDVSKKYFCYISGVMTEQHNCTNFTLCQCVLSFSL